MESYGASLTTGTLNLQGRTSSPIPILQGAILSPLLDSIYVDELLDTLSLNQIWIKEVFVGSPMYADDLALVADMQCPLLIQSIINTVYEYSCTHLSKSSILVFGESVSV